MDEPEKYDLYNLEKNKNQHLRKNCLSNLNLQQ